MSLRSSTLRQLSGACACLCLLAVHLRAQPLTATLLFDVRDTTGASLPGVALSVTHLASGVDRSATTTDEGLAAVSLLPPGDYTVKATLGGFKQTSVETFHLEAGARRSFTIVLTPGDVAETVTVRGETPVVDTQTVGANFNISKDLINATPGGRDIWNLIEYKAPGVVVESPDVGGNQGGLQRSMSSRGTPNA